MWMICSQKKILTHISIKNTITAHKFNITDLSYQQTFISTTDKLQLNAAE